MSDPEPTPELSSEQIVEAIYTFAAEQMQQGVSSQKIQQQLIEKGLDAESAQTVMRNLEEVKSRAYKAAGKKNMMFGALWCVGGGAVTLFTYQAAANNPGGGSYVVAWGAIAFGAIQFIRGLGQSTGG